jgi:hypothetical protein
MKNFSSRRRQLGYFQVDLAPFQNVVATGKATADLNSLVGRTVDRIILTLGGTALTKAMLTNIRLLANEKVIFEDTGPRVDDRMEYRGETSAVTALILDFNEARARSIAMQHAGAIDTLSAGIKKMSLEVDITGATAPTLAAQALVSRSPYSGDPLYNRLIAKVFQKTFNPGGAGEFLFPVTFSRAHFSQIKRMHLFGATVTAARVKTNEDIFKATDAQNDFIQTDWGRVPQANVFTIDFCADGDVSAALRVSDWQTIEWYMTVSGAGNVTAVTELLDPLENN